MNKKYKMIQIDEDVHRHLKQFCNDRGYKIKGLVESLIKDRISTKPTTNILKSNSTKV